MALRRINKELKDDWYYLSDTEITLLFAGYIRKIKNDLYNKDIVKLCASFYEQIDVEIDVTAGPKGDDFFKWIGTISGPKNSPYEGGIFFVDILFSQDYPFKAPKTKLATKIYHCNFNEHGGHCLDIDKENWSPGLTLKKIMWSLQNMFIDANPHDPLRIEIANLYKTNRAKHDKIAREWTFKYAQ
eukprot:219433_1